jgi:hypothetical protein
MVIGWFHGVFFSTVVRVDVVFDTFCVAEKLASGSDDSSIILWRLATVPVGASVTTLGFGSSGAKGGGGAGDDGEGGVAFPNVEPWARVHILRGHRFTHLFVKHMRS